MDKPCVYKKVSGSTITFLVLYVDDILLIGNDVGAMSSIKLWLSSHFAMKDLGEASYILGIKLFRGRKKRYLGLSQVNYITRSWLGLACKIPRKGFHFLDMEFISLNKCVLKHKKRERERARERN